MAPFLRYLVTASVALYVAGVVGMLLEGQGLIAFVASAIAMLWVGWITVLVCLPLFLVFLLVLPRAYVRFAEVPYWAIGAAAGFLVWVAAAILFAGLGSALSEPGPGASPVTPLSLLAFTLVVGAFGALVGLVESHYSRWSPTVKGQRDLNARGHEN